tara:strand:+ start:2176 stop:2871 length:696 start_codon:yes stop_codon:yes gene_type:complete
MKLIKLLGMIALLSLTQAAQAELIHSDYKSDGDELASLDVSTGIEWLKLSESNNMSITDAKNASNGGSLDGWRLPTDNELKGLLSDVFAGVINFREGVTQYAINYSTYEDAVNTWLDFIGVARTDGTKFWAFGFAEDDSGKVDLNGVYVNGNTAYVYLDFEHALYNDTFKSDGQSVFLVSDGGLTKSSIEDPSRNANNPEAPVNVSSPFALASLMLLPFALTRRKKACKVR